MQKSTPKAFHIIARGRGAAAHPGFAKRRFVYAESVTQKVTSATLYNTFGVGLVHQLRVRGCAATLGYGVKPLRGKATSPAVTFDNRRPNAV